MMVRFTPSYLVELDLAMPTGRHLPHDGGGWEGGLRAPIAGGLY